MDLFLFKPLGPTFWAYSTGLILFPISMENLWQHMLLIYIVLYLLHPHSAPYILTTFLFALL
jgi:hypothetical protein